MRTVIKVERTNCCVFNNSLNRDIASLGGVYGVNIDNYRNEVTVDHTDEVDFSEIFLKLKENGYSPLDEGKYGKPGYSKTYYNGLFQE